MYWYSFADVNGTVDISLHDLPRDTPLSLSLSLSLSLVDFYRGCAVVFVLNDVAFATTRAKTDKIANTAMMG